MDHKDKDFITYPGIEDSGVVIAKIKPYVKQHMAQDFILSVASLFEAIE